MPPKSIHPVTLAAMAVFSLLICTVTTRADTGSAQLDEAAVNVWIKSESGPQWGQRVKLGQNELTYTDGVLRLDLSEFESGDFKMAVLTLAVTAPVFEAGQGYSIALEAKSSGGASAVLLMPEDSGEVDAKGKPKPRSQWFRAGGDWPQVSETFTYDPEVGDGLVKLFFTAKQAGNIFEFRGLEIDSSEAGSEPK